MAIQALTRTTDTIEIVSIQDPSLDEQSTPRDALTAYCTAEDLDISKLKFHNDAPTLWKIRPLNEHEVAIISELGSGNNVNLTYMTVRLALVSVTNCEGFEESRELFCGHEALTLDCIQWVPWETIQFVALCIWKISRLDERQKKVSTSRQPKAGRRDGTTKTNSTAKRAKSTRALSAS